VFPASGSLLAAPPFPRSGPGEPGSPTSAVLRGRYDFPLTYLPVAYWVRSRVPRDPSLRFVLAVAGAPGRPEAPPRARIVGQPAIPFSRRLARGHEWDLSGSQAIHPVPLPRSTTPAGPTSPRQWRSRRCCPCEYEHKGSSVTSISRLDPRGFGTCCLRFTSDVAIAHARLASGRLAGLCREGVEPSGPR
jgi:hypothetical protein